MRPATIAALVLISVVDRANADDFSGFYAGVHAGYARGRTDERGAPAAAPGRRSGPPGAAGSDLPPSAADAVTGLRSSRPTPR